MKKFLIVLTLVLVVLASYLSVNHYMQKRNERAAQATALVSTSSQEEKATADLLATRRKELLEARTVNVKLCVFIEQYYSGVKLPKNVNAPAECAQILSEQNCEISPTATNSATELKGVCEEFAN